MATSPDAVQATTTSSVETDSSRGIDPSAAKPAERFLIGVLIALFIILGLCAIFLMRRVVLYTAQRLRRQQSAVNGIINQKRRRRRPRFFDLWIKGTSERQDNFLNAQDTWESIQPLAMTIEYPDTPSTNNEETKVEPRNVQHALVVDSSLCQPGQAHCQAERGSIPIDDPSPSHDECTDLRRLSDSMEATARIRVLIALPNQSRSIYHPSIPSSSPPQHTSGSWTDQPYLIATCSCDVEATPVPKTPSIALGVVPSPLIMYQ
ncbi:hypothetical protein M408DRAFT_327903 [Serendipita vermifera MAFF 305830]|uniref:Uncharacterized protein n=1 Tax=Serendipita vermifera MAFF 305830 TaxID=933852 RepID=A0A0C2XPV9_SERVB|nr:hypothetical protein M408DRAFT_327903 [Serendipita vermifera MAFF 305830]